MVKFIWDENKNTINKEKHGISFEEASTVFLDNDSVIVYDDEHSDKEDRFLIIGLSLQFNILVVCHCYLENDTVVRLISARKANIKESDIYIGTDERLLRFFKRKKESVRKTFKEADHN